MPLVQHQDTADFPYPADRTLDTILADFRKGGFVITLVDPAAGRIIAVQGKDTWITRAVTWTVLVTTTNPDRCRVQVNYTATTNSVVNEKEVIGKFHEWADQTLKVLIPLLLSQNLGQQGSGQTAKAAGTDSAKDETSSTNRCPICGDPLLGVSTICGKCQVQIAREPQTTAVSSNSARANQAIGVWVVVGIIILIGWALFAGKFSDTGRAERAVEEKFGATGVDCRRLGDLFGDKRFDCTGRYMGTDGFQFSVDIDGDYVHVEMGHF